MSDILKQRDVLKKEWENNGSKSKTRFTYVCKYSDVNELTFEWFKHAKAKNVPISGPIICEKAISVAEKLEITDFKASIGWHNSFKLRNNITYLKVCGESADVNCVLVDDFKSRVPDILSGYAPENVFHCDETGLFFRSLPDKTLRCYMS